jgi:hypothetical protein
LHTSPVITIDIQQNRPIEADDEVEEMDGSELLDALQEHRDGKKARVAPPSAYTLPLTLLSACSVGLRLC